MKLGARKVDCLVLMKDEQLAVWLEKSLVDAKVAWKVICSADSKAVRKASESVACLAVKMVVCWVLTLVARMVAWMGN